MKLPLVYLFFIKTWNSEAWTLYQHILIIALVKTVIATLQSWCGTSWHFCHTSISEIFLLKGIISMTRITLLFPVITCILKYFNLHDFTVFKNFTNCKYRSQSFHVTEMTLDHLFTLHVWNQTLETWILNDTNGLKVSWRGIRQIELNIENSYCMMINLTLIGQFTW